MVEINIIGVIGGGLPVGTAAGMKKKKSGEMKNLNNFDFEVLEQKSTRDDTLPTQGGFRNVIKK